MEISLWLGLFGATKRFRTAKKPVLYIAESTTLALRIENVDITGFERLEILNVCMESTRIKVR